MSALARRGVGIVLVALLVVAVVSTPVAAHEGHASHESQQEDDRSIWPIFVVFGTLSAGGTLLASRRLEIPREIAIGLTAGGIAIAVGAAVVWLS